MTSSSSEMDGNLQTIEISQNNNDYHDSLMLNSDAKYNNCVQDEAYLLMRSEEKISPKE